jgi:uncharacterized membrane protein YsdA (DUF1294 family)
MNRIEESRREVELRLAELREALRSEIGRAPKRRAWLLALLAGAAGLAIATRLRGHRRATRKRRLRE